MEKPEDFNRKLFCRACGELFYVRGEEDDEPDYMDDCPNCNPEEMWQWR